MLKSLKATLPSSLTEFVHPYGEEPTVIREADQHRSDHHEDRLFTTPNGKRFG